MSKTILICDDELIVRMNLKSLLFDLGFDEVFECSDGKRAVETALSSFPDMVIMDVAMPEMDGISAATEIRKKLKIPIVLLTNCYDGQTAKRAAKCGIAAFLTKPLRGQDLLPALELALAHSEEIDGLKEKIDDLQEIIDNRKIIEKAKGLIMAKEHFSEAEAYRFMQKMAMDKRKSLRQIADLYLKQEK